MNGLDFSLSAEQRELTEATAALGRELNQDLMKREDAVTADGAGNLTCENVLDHCRQWLPGHMVPDIPDIVEFREAPPRTSTGPTSPRSSTNWRRPETADGTSTSGRT